MERKANLPSVQIKRKCKRYSILEKKITSVATKIFHITPKACALTATIVLAESKSLGDAAIRNSMPLECAKIATLTTTTRKKENKHLDCITKQQT